MEKSEIEQLIEIDPIAHGFSDWLKSYDYDRWKELVVWADSDDLDFFTELNALRMAMQDHGVYFMAVGDD